MILKPGEKVHVIHRQLYDDDVRRHFVGVVDACEGNLARVTGHLFAMDHKLNQFSKREGLRTRIIALDSGTTILNVLPERVKIEDVTYQFHNADDIVVTDGTDWHFELTHL